MVIFFIMDIILRFDTIHLLEYEKRVQMTEIHEKKNQLRHKMKQIQSELTSQYMDTASDRIQSRILKLEKYKKAKSIFVYVNMEKEPQTVPIIEQAIKDGKKVYVPKCISKSEMLAIHIQSVSQLKPGSYGILEPEDLHDTGKAEEMDLILVPCLSASLDGRRLGHGAGYYDRFLREYHGDMICLCYKKMLSDEIPVDDLDIRMPSVITD